MCDWDASDIDFVKVLASLDGGADVVVLKWDSGSEDDISEPARLADDPNALLTSTAQEVQRNISGNATSMTLKLVIAVGATDEDIAVSNLVLTCDAVPTTTTEEPPQPCTPQRMQVLVPLVQRRAIGECQAMVHYTRLSIMPLSHQVPPARCA
eukprot:s25_g27.t1